MSEAAAVSPILAALPRHIDISCVQAFHSMQDIRELAADARAGGFVSAHVLPGWVPLMRELLDGSETLTGSPAGFPSGGSMVAAKVFEAEQLLAAGVQELDVVVNVGRLRSGDVRYVTAELAELAELVGTSVPLRAILEVGYLDDDQIRAGCDCVLEAGVQWVKTGTGWSGRATARHHVKIIAERVAGRASIKAAGGIRNIATVRDMVALGVTRFGMNAGVARQLVAASVAEST